jgi:hypothetical protein
MVRQDKEINTNFLDYEEGNADVLQATITISREVTAGGQQYIHVIAGGQELYSFWHNPKKSKNPKHTGGKAPYIMVMTQELEKFKTVAGDSDFEVESCIGFLTCMAKYIEWKTGKLIHPRSKKALKYKDLVGIVTFGKRKLDSVIYTLKDFNLLSHTAEGYFVSRKIIKKGQGEIKFIEGDD